MRSQIIEHKRLTRERKMEATQTITSHLKPMNYWQHCSRRPIHVVRNNAKRECLNARPPYEINRRNVIIDGITLRAQRLNEFSRQLNQFTTTGKPWLVRHINGKNQNRRLAQKSDSQQRWPVPKLVPATQSGGNEMR